VTTVWPHARMRLLSLGTTVLRVLYL